MNSHLQTRMRPTTPPGVTPVLGGLLQRKCACGGNAALSSQCEECRKKDFEGSSHAGSLVQRRTAARDGSEVPPIVYDVLRSPGQPLDAATRAFFEPRFGHDFSRVRIHTDDRAAESARAVNAMAYTVGREVVFADSQYSPLSTNGKLLIAHELSHVMQQGADPARGRLEIGQSQDPFEQEAARIATETAVGRTRHPASRPSSRTKVSLHSSSGRRLRRWAYGLGAPPHADYVEVPVADKKRIEAAMAIVSKIVNHPKDFPQCPKFFKDHCPGGDDGTLVKVFNDARVWNDTDPDPHLLGSSVDPHHIAYTRKSFGVGRWAIAASMFHELIHNCGVVSHDVGDDAKEACGKLPNI